METVKQDISLRITESTIGGGFVGQNQSLFSKDYSHFCVRKKSKRDLGYVCTKLKTELESPKLFPRFLLLKGCNIKARVK
jgi:hypothetical protein